MSTIIPSAAKLFGRNVAVTKVAAPPLLHITKLNAQNRTTKKEACFEIKPYKLYKLDKGPGTCTTLTAEEGLKLYEQMMMVRKIESACATLYKEKVIRGFCHLYSGQEAVAVGMRAVVRDIDSLITAYRCHGFTHLWGVSALGVIAELTGRNSGCSRGKGGSMHLYAKNFYGGNGIVGAQTPIGAGLAFAHKYRNDGGVAYTIYGDGAANQGQLFEAYNMAALWNLPCVFICENNKYGLGTAAHRASFSVEYFSRANYIPGLWVDGMDVLATRDATRFAHEYVTSGKGPLVIEMETYRYYGHSMSDPGTSYRTRDEIQEVRQMRDPITSFKDKLISSELATEEQLKEINSKVKIHVDEAYKQSKIDPEVGLEELTADVYNHTIATEVRGTYPLKRFKHLEIAKRVVL